MAFAGKRSAAGPKGLGIRSILGLPGGGLEHGEPFNDVLEKAGQLSNYCLSTRRQLSGHLEIFHEGFIDVIFEGKSQATAPNQGMPLHDGGPVTHIEGEQNGFLRNKGLQWGSL